ncbi:MAG: alpha/beta fold hydrolase [Acidimicrobiales bacterium]|nr:alpha/beta fold hydrolase [Acidimicrobiales bacterium]
MIRATVHEAASVARCAAAYPQGILEMATRTGTPCGDLHRDTPVVLVHGYGHNASAWLMLRAALKRNGFTSVHTMNYNPWTHDVPKLAEKLSDKVEVVKELTGSDRVNLVGHSLGGIVCRWYVQEMGGDKTVGTAITLASPHAGTLAAFAGPGRTARSLRPNSWVMKRLTYFARPTDVRWVAFYGDSDALIQPMRSGSLDVPALNARNVLVPGMGHLGMLLDGEVVTQVIDELLHPPMPASALPLFAKASEKQRSRTLEGRPREQKSLFA